MQRLTGLGQIAALGLTLAAASSLMVQSADRTLVRPSAAGAERRLALVVGNNAYLDAPLRNAVNDAEAMAATLRSVGFAVTLKENTKLVDLDRAAQTFAAQVKPGDVALFFYSGHGIQIAGENYLVPVDFAAVDEIDAKHAALSADLVREKLDAAGARLKLIVLDACRNNPFRAVRSGSGGLATMQGGAGTYIAFATEPNRTASDNPAGANGLFTTHLLAALRTPGLSLAQVFSRVREGVYQASNHAQLPWSVDGVIGDFIFRPAAAAPVTPVAPPPPVPSFKLKSEALASASIEDVSADCDLGHLAACDELGVRYRNGRGVTKDEARAAGLFDKACSGHDRSGCTLLGVMYEAGLGITRDASKAAMLYQQACDAGLPVACSNLARQYRDGDGVAKDELRAAALFDKACREGYAQACHQLAAQYEIGQGVSQDRQKARSLYTTACDAKHQPACDAVARLSIAAAPPPAATRPPSSSPPAPGGSPGFKLREDQVDGAPIEALNDDCNLGHVSACFRLGMRYELGLMGAPKDESRAAAPFQRACNGGEPYGCLHLGEFYAKGLGVPHDATRAVPLFQRACDGKSLVGCFFAGLFYEEGLGVRADVNRAIAFYRRACGKEIEEQLENACQALKRLGK